MVQGAGAEERRPARARARPLRRRDRRRRAAHPPGRLQPALQRGQVHAAGGRVDVRTARDDERGDDLRRATPGPGIAPDDQELIFEEFRQARVVEGERPEGTGLGLAPVAEAGRAARRAHLGRERAGRGQHLLVHPSRRVAARWTGRLVLVVEDNEKNMELVRDVLQAKGYRDARGDERAKRRSSSRLEHDPDLILHGHPAPGHRRRRPRWGGSARPRRPPKTTGRRADGAGDARRPGVASSRRASTATSRSRSTCRSSSAPVARLLRWRGSRTPGAILVVDDVPENVQLMEAVLVPRGYTVTRRAPPASRRSSWSSGEQPGPDPARRGHAGDGRLRGLPDAPREGEDTRCCR